MSKKSFTVTGAHVAANPMKGRQICIRCGEVLIDNRNVDYVAGDGPPRFFDCGSYVEKTEQGVSRVSSEVCKIEVCAIKATSLWPEELIKETFE